MTDITDRLMKLTIGKANEERDLPIEAVEVIEFLRSAIEDLLPYAQASIGLPEALWPGDSVILKARRALEAGGHEPRL